ncbi:hypothetical protein B0H17DRAFT_1330720 [Mycena rosella]|uniref:Uncharacterized protein n=1 Tax=Mycena rosella TaxID=1033263 RepID=A0AAD7GKS9_MYCRO|nr:hypothetical protein B0H17DRAFT_1330720 [Mycena rosella]
MDPEVDPTRSIIENVEVAWAIAATEVFLYGTYSVMFALYLHILRTRGMANLRFLTAATIVLFILSTAHCALQLATTIFGDRLLPALRGQDGDTQSYAYANEDKLCVSLDLATNGVAVADTILIYRCYAIWNYRRNIVILPILLTLVGAGFGCANRIISVTIVPSVSGLFIVSLATSLLTTVILMGLTGSSIPQSSRLQIKLSSVGRIWWLARAARMVLGPNIARKYHTVCAMILESGALYCIAGVGFVMVGLLVDIDVIVSGAVVAQVVGIAPTIIAVRVALGYSVENVDSFIVAQARPRPPPILKATISPPDSQDTGTLYIYSGSEVV